MSADNQVKSKDRVRDHGEVFTNKREVNSMLDLVKNETIRIDSRFLEPACGEGNFLEEILIRKLNVVENKYKKNINDYENYSILALSAIYGIDILEDNIKACKKRLLTAWEEKYVNLYKVKPGLNLTKSAKFILSKNMIVGDALTMKTIKGNRIVVSEWKLLRLSHIQRSDYYLDKLMNSPLKVKEIKNKKPVYVENKIVIDKKEKEFIRKVVSNTRMLTSDK